MSRSLSAAFASPEVTLGDSPLSRGVTGGDSELIWLGLVGRALGRCGLSVKAAALTMEIDRPQLSRQLAGAPHHHLSFRRMLRLGPEFWQEIIPLIVEFHGLTLHDSPQERADAEIGRLVREAVTRSLAR
jgi:hypothetical protein